MLFKNDFKKIKIELISKVQKSEYIFLAFSIRNLSGKILNSNLNEGNVSLATWFSNQSRRDSVKHQIFSNFLPNNIEKFQIIISKPKYSEGDLELFIDLNENEDSWFLNNEKLKISISNSTQEFLPSNYFDKIEEFENYYGKINQNILSNPKVEFRYFCYRYLHDIRKLELPEIPKQSIFEAVIVETRKFPHLEFIIRNNIEKLGGLWSHTIICGNKNYDFMLNLSKSISKNIKVIKIDFDDISVPEYSNLLSSLSFWELFQSEKVLIYQEDSFIFKKGIEEFLEYDFIGAPWKRLFFNKEQVGNGGFSLRSPKIMRDVINLVKNENTDWSLIGNQDKRTLELHCREKNYPPKLIPEDIYFCINLYHYKIGNLPTFEIANKFSTENIKNDISIGGHNFWISDQNWRQRVWNSVSILSEIEYQNLESIDVTIHQMCYNEIKILEFSYNFWKKRFPKAKFILHDNGSTDGSPELAERLGYQIVKFESGEKMDELTQTNVRNSCWKNDQTDWVIVVDMDELIDISEKDLVELSKKGKTIVKAMGFQMINLENKFDLENTTCGFWDHRYNKSLIFNKKFIDDMNWSVGSHSSKPTGKVVNYSEYEYNLLHYKYIGEDYVIERYRELKQRQSQNNIRNSWCTQYSMEESEIRKKYQEFLNGDIQNVLK